MAQSEKVGLKDYLNDLVTGTFVVLWFMAAEATQMQSSLALMGGLVVFAISAVFLITRRYFEHKKYIATLGMQEKEIKAKYGLEEAQAFMKNVQQPGSLALSSNLAKHNALMNVIRMLEETAKDESLPENVRNTYNEIKRRVGDMARAYWGI